MKSAQIKTITPTQAKDMLENSHANYRKANPAHVRYLSKEMAEGRWFMTYEPIVIDPYSGVVDGQQRLLAVIASGRPQQFLVVEGVATTDAVAAMDTGVSRTAGTVLRANSIKNYNEVAATAKSYIHASAGFYPWLSHGNSRKVSMKSILNLCESHPHIHDIIQICVRVRFRESGAMLCMSIIAMMAHDDSPEHAFAFLNEYERAMSIPDQTDPVRALYMRLLKSKASPNMRLVPYAKCAMVAKAYNAFVCGRPIGVLKFTPGENLALASAEGYCVRA